MQLYPVKSGTSAIYVEHTPQLVKQAVFGKQVQERLVQSTDGLAELIKHLEHKVEQEGGLWTLGGRFIPVDSPHKCLNYFCQGQGAESMKYYSVEVFNQFNNAGLIHGKDFILQATIYDELDFIVRDEHIQTVTDILINAYPEVSRQLNMKCTYTGEVLVGPDWQSCH